MRKYMSHFLRSGLLNRISGFHQRECVAPSKFRWTVPCLPVCLPIVDISGTKRFRSQVQTGYKDFRVGKLSSHSQFLKSMGSNIMIEENTENLNSQSTYDIAMEALSSLITSKRRGDGPEISTKYTKLERMMMYTKILGLEEHIAGLKIIHVAGTKGKGSTCSFCEAIMRECGLKTGLFTSPHLIDVRERFRLDGLDISEEKFLDYFWECWHQLKENVTDDLPMPPLFQFLTVLAFKIFACEKVDVAIIEVGLGGTRDSTNVIKDPVVCGVSPLGMDHMETLGDTLPLIASHKAGIFKPEVPAFTVPQLSEAMDVLQERARNLTVPLEVVAPLDRIKLKGKELSLSGDHQLTNAGLAVALCKSWLQRTGNWNKLFPHADLEDCLPDAFLRGLSTARLSGRADIIYDSSLPSPGMAGPSGDLIFYLDGAHSPESMEACARWFSSTVKDGPTGSSAPLFSSKLQHEALINGNTERGKNELEKVSKKVQISSDHCSDEVRSSLSICTNSRVQYLKQILLFNCMDVRDPQILLSKLVDTCALSGTYFEKAIFVPGISTYTKVTSGSSAILLDSPSKDLTWQSNLQRVWENIIHGTDAAFESQMPENTPPRNFLDEDVGCSSAVVSSLPITIDWLRDYVRQNPSSRIQVLVTGSLHLVGDVLKLLRR